MAGLSPTTSPRTPSTTSTTSTSTAVKSTSPLSPSTSLNPPPSLPLEVCVDSLESAIAAHSGGAHRLELCSGLTDGGVTPSYGLIGATLSATPLPLHVLIRPRPGDFLYTQADLAVIKADIMACKLLGVSGVVLGCLREDGRVDREALRELMAAAKGMSVTFHRAIDLTPPEHLEEELDALIDEGVDRVLSSGLAADALTGASTLRRMVEHVQGRHLVIMAGGGVTEHNVGQLVTQSGVGEVHASARAFQWSGMKYRKSGVYMGGEKVNAGLEVEYGRKVSDEGKVREMLRAWRERLMGGGKEERKRSGGA